CSAYGQCRPRLSRQTEGGAVMEKYLQSFPCTICHDMGSTECDCIPDPYAEIARLTAERDARDRAKVAEGLRMAAEIAEGLNGWGADCGAGGQAMHIRETILSRAKDMEAGNG